MVDPKSGRLRNIAWIAGMCAMAVMFACATSQSPGGGDESSSPEMALSQELVQIDVQREGGETVITLMGLEDPVYSAYRLQQENTLVIELPGVTHTPASLIAGAADSASRVVVYDGLVDEVTSSTYAGDAEPVTRIEVALAMQADYEVAPTSEGLAVWVRASADGPEDAAQDGPAEELAGTQLAEGEAEGSATSGGEPEDPWAAAEPLGASDDEAEAVEEIAASDIVEQMSAAADLEPAAPAVPAAPASALRALDVTVTEAGVLLHLQADGAISATETFTLEDPDRLVVDLPGLKNEISRNRIPVPSERVARVRVGAHPTKLRVVIDGGPEANGFQGRRVIPATDGLYLTVGSGADLDGALASSLSRSDDAGRPMEPVEMEPVETVAEQEAEQVAEQVAEQTALPVNDTQTEAVDSESEQETASVVESDAAEIYGLQYDSNQERDRVAVLSDQVIDYEVLTPDSETVVISIKNAVISSAVGERITPQPGGPLSLITTFQQPDVPGREVRVVMKRAPDLDPTLTRRGSLLFIDFENTGVAAAPPPAFVPGENISAAEEDLESELSFSESQVGDETSPGDSEELQATEPGEHAAVDPMSEMSDPAGDELVAEMVVGDEVAEDYGELPEPALPASLAVASAHEDEMVPTSAGAPPASLEPPAAVEILEEGGLIDGKEYAGRRISLDFKDVEISDVLRLIAEVSDLNIIAGDEVAGNVTIRLVDVPWDQALDVILLTKGLGFVRVGNVLRIAPSEILKVEEEVRLQERRNKEKLEDLEVKLQPVNYAAVKDVAELVKRLLSPRGTVNTDERTNTLIIKDISSVIDEATALIQAIDTQTPQVMIEARIVEANLEFSRALGSRWGAATQPFVNGFTKDTLRTDLGNENFRFEGDNSVTFYNPITSIPTGALSLGAFLLDDQMEVNVNIDAMEASGDGKVISSPRIVTLDNREAVIEQGISIPFQTFENGDAKLEFIDAVLSLKVTPHITTDRSIIMGLEVTRNAPDASVSTPTGSPAIAKNQAKTETLVKDGQTLVIGGIYTVDKTTRETRVPYLHRIPVLGAAFKSREVTDLRKELLIFVTPRVVVNPELAAN